MPPPPKDLLPDDLDELGLDAGFDTDLDTLGLELLGLDTDGLDTLGLDTEGLETLELGLLTELDAAGFENNPPDDGLLAAGLLTGVEAGFDTLLLENKPPVEPEVGLLTLGLLTGTDLFTCTDLFTGVEGFAAAVVGVEVVLGLPHPKSPRFSLAGSTLLSPLVVGIFESFLTGV